MKHEATASEYFERVAAAIPDRVHALPWPEVFTAACGPLLGFVRANPQTRLVGEAFRENFDWARRDAINGLMAGMAHLRHIDRIGLRHAVCGLQIVAGMQHC
jgi:hypothetical protein